MGVKLLFSVWKVLHWLEIQLLFVIEGIGATPFLTAKLHVRNPSHHRMAGNGIEISGMDAL